MPSYPQPVGGDRRRPADVGTGSDSPGSLGIAISEAVEAAVKREDTKYSLGSVLNHVMLHQTIIGLEAEKQMGWPATFPMWSSPAAAEAATLPGCRSLLAHRLKGRNIRFVGAEPYSCPTMSSGQYRYDFGDTTKLTPLVKMYTLGHSYIPPESMPADSVPRHGPMVSLGVKLGLIEAAAYHQLECFEAAQLFACTEGLIPAPETPMPFGRRLTRRFAVAENREECMSST